MPSECRLESALVLPQASLKEQHLVLKLGPGPIPRVELLVSLKLRKQEVGQELHLGR